MRQGGVLGFVSGCKRRTESARRSHTQTGTAENRWSERIFVWTNSDHAAGQEVPSEPLNRRKWSVSLRSLSGFWIQLDYYWEDTTHVLSSFETLSRFSKLELSLICSYHIFQRFGFSCTDTFLCVYLWSDSICEVPCLNAKHLWNMGHFVVQVDLPWILCSLRLVIMISMFYCSTNFEGKFYSWLECMCALKNI